MLVGGVPNAALSALVAGVNNDARSMGTGHLSGIGHPGRSAIWYTCLPMRPDPEFLLWGTDELVTARADERDPRHGALAASAADTADEKARGQQPGDHQRANHHEAKVMQSGREYGPVPSAAY